MNKIIRWNSEKAETLRNDKLRGGISFEDCVIAIETGRVLDIVQNPNPKYVNQGAYVLNIEGYAYFVPYVESEKEIFLKTMYPSRKYTARYLGRTSK